MARRAALSLLLVAGCYAAPTTLPDEPAFAGCTIDAIIEDGENADDQILVADGRSGYLYTYADEHGTKVAPSGDFHVEVGGAAGTRYALRFSGKLGTGAENFAGLGLSFVEPKAGYDATMYQGISFIARHGPGSIEHVRVKLPDAATDPDGGLCKECYNDFGADVPLTEEWTRFTLAFADMKQQAGWGQPNPPAIDASQLYGVQWQVAEAPGRPFDIWIDAVSFMGCQ